MNSFPCLINTQASVFIHICLLANNHQGVKHFLLSQALLLPRSFQTRRSSDKKRSRPPCSPQTPLSSPWQAESLAMCALELVRASPSLTKDWTPAECVCNAWRAQQGSGRCWMVCWWLLAAVLLPVPEAVGCASLVAMGIQLLPWALSSLLQHIKTMATASGWMYSISCKPQTDLPYPGSTPSLLWLHDAVSSRKTDCPTLWAFSRASSSWCGWKMIF